MLTYLTIQNVALADELQLEFKPGLNVITGETGAGKSIIIGAIAALTGARVGPAIIREGEEKAAISGAFQLDDGSEAVRRLREADLWESDDVIFSRDITTRGGSRCRLNGRLVNVSDLATVGRSVVDIYGQHDHQSLLKPGEHLALLDALGDTEITPLKQKVAALYERRQRLRREIDRLHRDTRERERQVDLLKYQIEEIDEAQLSPGEDVEIDEQLRLMSHAERLVAAVTESYAIVYDGDDMAPGVTHRLGEVIAALEPLRDVDDVFQTFVNQMYDALATLEDVARELRDYGENVRFDPDTLNDLNERKQLIDRLKRKYGSSVDEVIAFGEHCREQLQALTDEAQSTEALQAEEKRVTAELTEVAGQLSSVRRQMAGPLCRTIEQRLSSLNMEGARFEAHFGVADDENGIVVDDRPVRVTADGIDDVRFVFSANPGESPKPLAHIASGGEMSRVMLAVKTAATEVKSTSTLIFDEVDAGLGGRTAEKVADALAELAQTHQVLVVTHLAAIAARAHHHLAVEKREQDGRTTVAVTPLVGDARIREISRMLDGSMSDTSLKHAAAMLRRARTIKV